MFERQRKGDRETSFDLFDKLGGSPLLSICLVISLQNFFTHLLLTSSALKRREIALFTHLHAYSKQETEKPVIKKRDVLQYKKHWLKTLTTSTDEQRESNATLTKTRRRRD